MSLPERINVMRVITYDVQQVCDNIRLHTPVDEITLEEILDWIDPWVEEDFGGVDNWRKDLIYQDENGEEL